MRACGESIEVAQELEVLEGQVELLRTVYS